MHGDATAPESDEAWGAYFGRLHASGAFKGGSSIGVGDSFRKSGAAAPVSGQLIGFIRVEATDLAAARLWLAGNPVYESGGTVEVRELPMDS
jgi:hypothetical protein